MLQFIAVFAAHNFLGVPDQRSPYGGQSVGKVIRLIIGLLLIPLALSFIHEAWLFLRANLSLFVSNWSIYGAITYLLLSLVLLGNRLRFLEFLEHELGHTIIALLHFYDVKVLLVNTEGGLIAYQGPSNFLVALAPYFLPVFTIPLVIVKPLIFSSVHNIFDFLIGFTLAFHYLALLKEFRFRQPDIQTTGPVFSLVLTVTLNVIFLVIILSVVLGSFPSIRSYFENAIARTIESYTYILQEWIRSG
jgi:hypothetical protein